MQVFNNVRLFITQWVEPNCGLEIMINCGHKQLSPHWFINHIQLYHTGSWTTHSYCVTDKIALTASVPSQNISQTFSEKMNILITDWHR